MVCPALFPPAHLAQTSASAAKISTSFPFPSSPHCAPSTTVTVPLEDIWGCENAMTRMQEEKYPEGRGKYRSPRKAKEGVMRAVGFKDAGSYIDSRDD